MVGLLKLLQEQRENFLGGIRLVCATFLSKHLYRTLWPSIAYVNPILDF